MSDAYWQAPISWNLKAAKKGVKARVFCSSMADVFESHPTLEEQRQRLWPLIRATPWLQWLLLTKRPENVLPSLPVGWISDFPENVMLGFTAENQEWYDQRHAVASMTSRPWFVSYEPALGPIDFRGLGTIAWVIAGAEKVNGRPGRPMREEWVRSARDQCIAAGVPFFFKQGFLGDQKVSLPMLDGRQWKEFPQ